MKASEDTAFILLLRDCARIKDFYRGTHIHAGLLKTGLLNEGSHVADALVTMYAKCGALVKARDLLEAFSVRDVFSWTALIAGYVQHGQGQDALNCFDRMQSEGVSPHAVTFACILKACGSIGAPEKGEEIHAEIAKQGLLSKDVVLGNALVNMYAKCGALVKAREVLDRLPSRDVVSWCALIVGYTQQGHGQDALICFDRMRSEGLCPDAVTFSCVLKACGSLRVAEKGKQIHDEISERGLLRNDIILGTGLVDMYAKCGALSRAQQVLEKLPARNVVSWSALITGYAQQGHGQEALKCYGDMQREGLCPDAVTFAGILKACGSIGALDKGEEIHDKIAKEGLLANNVVLGNALVGMYAKCGALAKARGVLDELPIRSPVSWTALIDGYTEQGHGEEALSCFEHMKRKGISPDPSTFSCVLVACGSIGAIDRGEQIHDEIAKQRLLENNIVLGNALVDMYAKCGALSKARQVLKELPAQDVVSWNALIAGCAQQGLNHDALDCFEGMQCKGLSPDLVTFSCILKACSHSGLVEEGQMYFARVSTNYDIKPNLEHYTCMIDLFGRTGHLDKAVVLIQKMPSHDHCVVWHALMGACRKWEQVNIGRWAFKHALQIDASDLSVYILMANIYTAAGMPKHAEKIDCMRVENKAWWRAKHFAGF